MSFQQFLSKGVGRFPTIIHQHHHRSMVFLNPIRNKNNHVVVGAPNGLSNNNSNIMSWSMTTLRTFATKKHKNLLKHTKGFRGRSKNCFRIAIRRLHKSWQYGYRDRKRKRREWSKLWIQKIQAGVRQYSWRYSEFMGALSSIKKKNTTTTTGSSGSTATVGGKSNGEIKLDRKILAELAANEPFAFRSVVQVVEHITGKE